MGAKVVNGRLAVGWKQGGLAGRWVGGRGVLRLGLLPESVATLRRLSAAIRFRFCCYEVIRLLISGCPDGGGGLAGRRIFDALRCAGGKVSAAGGCYQIDLGRASALKLRYL